ncbi:MAG: hypothetical protein WCK49_01735 [Myxococcaceae bacterium]
MRKILLLCLLALPLSAYEYKSGEWLLRAVLGKAVYFVQADKTVIGDNILTGVELEYMLDPKFSLTGAVRPLFAVGSVNLGFGAGAKYRFVNKEVPLIPFVSLALTPSVYIPTVGEGSSYFNLGIRPTAGFEYFVARDLSLGIEVALNPNFIKRDTSFEVLAGATWRL